MNKKRCFTFILAVVFAVMAVAMMFSGCAKEDGSMTGNNDGKERLVGVTYSTWFPPLTGQKWGTPILGEYNSSDEAVIEQHAKWLVDAGVDFIMIDWTNNMNHVYGEQDGNLEYIESATAVVFDVFARLEKAPKIVIAGGVNSADQALAFVDGTMQRRANEIWDNFYGKPEYQDLILHFEGKPLLCLYLSTPAVAAKPGDEIFSDERYTIKYFTGFLGQQENLVREGTRISKYGYWSWWERGNNVYAVNEDGSAECITISAAWVGEAPPDEAIDNPNSGWLQENGGMGRRNGDTFREQWDMAIGLDPEIVLVQSFNEWVSETLPGKAAEEYNAEYSNDIEPSVEHGYLYMNILKEKAAIYKNGGAE